MNISRKINRAKRKSSISSPAGYEDFNPPSGSDGRKLDRPDHNVRMNITTTVVLRETATGKYKHSSPSGSHGGYLIRFALSKPGLATHALDLNYPDLIRSGTSFLLLKDPVCLVVDAELGQQEIYLKPNSAGELALIEMKVVAADFRAAEECSHNLVMPLISHLSFEHQVPLAILGYEVQELATGGARYSYQVLGRSGDLRLDALEGLSLRRCRPLLSAYREGLNSDNPFHKFLCFFKVTEGIRRLRKEANRVQLFRDNSRSPIEERLAADYLNLRQPAELEEVFTPYLGWSYSKVLEHFRGVYRNACAHLYLDSDIDRALAADDYQSFVSCEMACPVIRFIAYKMLRHEIAAQQTLAQQPKI